MSKATNSDRFNSHNRSLQSFVKNTIPKCNHYMLPSDLVRDANKENYLEINKQDNL